jgi:peptide/nickel transport system substrate-binding protein
MRIRASLLAALAGCTLTIASCTEDESGPIAVSAIGAAPQLANPNLVELDAPSSFLIESVAQGLVRFDAAGEIEPALAQSWIVSDDGLRYTFRIRSTEWSGGGRVTAQQVVARLKAAASPASRNALKPILGAVDEIVAMTDHVLEISLVGPRPNFLQILAQPEMAIVRDAQGTGPYQAQAGPAGTILLSLPPSDDEDAEQDVLGTELLLRADRVAVAVARFLSGEADLVTGGTVGDLPVARAGDPAPTALAFDPAAGLFGLAFTREEAWSDPALRNALNMAVDREALLAALAVPGLQPRLTLLPPGLEEFPSPTVSDWAASPMPMRRQMAAQVIAGGAGEEMPPLRVAMPPGPGYRMIFAHLQRDWRLIGVEAALVQPGAAADLRFIDAVAPAALPSWYLRQFTCERRMVCDPAADEMLDAARSAANPAERRNFFAEADRILAEVAPFIPIAAPIRWSLVSPRLTGFRPNPFARHAPGELIAERP